MNHAYETIRVVNVGLYLLVLYGFWRHRGTYVVARPQLRMLLVGIGLLVLYGLYSTIELLVSHSTGGPRTLISPVPLLFLATSLHLDVISRKWRDRK